MYTQELRSPGADSHVKRGRFSVMARYSVSACRSCSRNPADSARVRSRSARPHIRPAVRATSGVSTSASADSPPDASVAIHVTTVTPATITSTITAARRKRSGDRAGPDTGDAREPSSAVAMPQGISVNSDSAPSHRRTSLLERTSFSLRKAVFLSLRGDAPAQHDNAVDHGHRPFQGLMRSFGANGVLHA